VVIVGHVEIVFICVSVGDLKRKREGMKGEDRKQERRSKNLKEKGKEETKRERERTK